MAETSLCRLCLFKSEPLDEVCLEENYQLEEIIEEIFVNKVSLYFPCIIVSTTLPKFSDQII